MGSLNPVRARGVRWLLLVAALLCASLLQFDPPAVGAKDADKEISGLTLSSDSPGTLQVSWDEANPAPDDYRVNWGKTSEGFAEHGDRNGNAYPESSSHTITGLDEGEEYKVHVRARYSGESPGPWSDTVTLVVASQPAQIEEEEQQAADKEISGLTLSSDSPGTLQVSWDEANPAPDDYRVNWGKTSKGFAPLGDRDGNAYPESNSHTITGLDEGEEYKVHVRARYSGESPGPWSDTVTLVVASQPAQAEEEQQTGDESPTTVPARPTGLAASATSEAVTLTWDDPGDPSITGYLVYKRKPDNPYWRGGFAVVGKAAPDAFAYTDLRVQPGERIVYRVQAENAKGRSTWSSWAEANIPHPEPEQEIVAVGPDSEQETVVVEPDREPQFILVGPDKKSGEGQGDGGLRFSPSVVNDPVTLLSTLDLPEEAEFGIDSGVVLGQGFTTGPSEATLNSVTLSFATINSSVVDSEVTVTIRRPSGSTFSSTPLYTLETPDIDGTGRATGRYTFAVPDGVDALLDVNTAYYVVIEVANDRGLDLTTTGTRGSTGEPGWTTDFEIRYIEDGTGRNDPGAQFLMALSGTSAPPLVSNLDQARYDSLWIVDDGVVWGQGFETGRRASILEGVTLRLEDIDSGVEDSEVTVTIRRRAGSVIDGTLTYHFGSVPLYTLETPDFDSIGRADGDYTFTVPGNVDAVLEPDTEYYVVIEVDDGTGLYFAITMSGRDTGETGWIIQDRIWHREGGQFISNSGISALTALYGTLVPDFPVPTPVLTANIDQPPDRLTLITDGFLRGQGFATGPEWAVLDSVTLPLSRIDPGVSDGDVTVTIREKSGDGFASTALYTLRTPDIDGARVRAAGNYTFTVRDGESGLLEPDADYYVVVEVDDSRGLRVGMTSSPDEDGAGAPGWTIHNGSRSGQFRSGDVLEQEEDGMTTMRVALSGTIISGSPPAATTLVTNRDERHNHGLRVFGETSSEDGISRAQGFETGPVPAKLSSVALRLEEIHSGVVDGEVTVTIRERSGTSFAATALYTLETPDIDGARADGNYMFTVRDGVTGLLQADTVYYVHIAVDDPEGLTVRFTTGDSETGRPGWSIHDGSKWHEFLTGTFSRVTDSTNSFWMSLEGTEYEFAAQPRISGASYKVGSTCPEGDRRHGNVCGIGAGGADYFDYVYLGYFYNHCSLGKKSLDDRCRVRTQGSGRHYGSDWVALFRIERSTDGETWSELTTTTNLWEFRDGYEGVHSDLGRPDPSSSGTPPRGDLWYRIIAIDNHGRHSQPSDPVKVTVRGAGAYWAVMRAVLSPVDTPATLVTNQNRNRTLNRLVNGESGSQNGVSRAQGFETGPVSAILHSVILRLSNIDSGVDDSEVTVTIREQSGTSFAATALYTLETPDIDGARADGNYMFTVPDGVIAYLEPDTVYYVHIAVDDPDGLSVAHLADDGESGEPGWTIHDGTKEFHFRGTVSNLVDSTNLFWMSLSGEFASAGYCGRNPHAWAPLDDQGRCWNRSQFGDSPFGHLGFKRQDRNGVDVLVEYTFFRIGPSEYRIRAVVWDNDSEELYLALDKSLPAGHRELLVLHTSDKDGGNRRQYHLKDATAVGGGVYSWPASAPPFSIDGQTIVELSY